MTQHLFVCGTSRSGTTLLCTILDAHPRIAMGNELMPGGLGTVSNLIEVLEVAIASEQRPAAWIRKAHGRTGPFKLMNNSNFVGVGAAALLEVCRDIAGTGVTDLSDAGERARLAMAILERKRSRSDAVAVGCKANTMALGKVYAAFPHGRFVLIVRDPLDVAASQWNRFERPAADVARRWNAYHQAFLDLPVTAHTAIVRYEDLVADLNQTLTPVLGTVGEEVTPEVMAFFASDAGILGTRNFNAANVGSNLYESSVGRGKRELSRSDRKTVERTCRTLMKRFGY